jgi:integrase
MPRQTKALTDTLVRQAKGKERTYRLFDGGGLYLEVQPTGARYWRMKYRYGGKEKRLALGVYPGMTLSDARDERARARRTLASGTDPMQEKRAARVNAETAAANTFQAVAAEWLSKQRRRLAVVTYAKAQWLLGFANAELGGRPLADLTARDLLSALRKIEAAGKHETAHRVKQRMSQVFRYAIATGRADRDPTADLRGALAPIVPTSRAAITDPAQVGELLRAIDSYGGRAQPVTIAALKLAPLVFLRPGELRAAEWAEIDLDAAEWRVPAARMKMRQEHIVPLAPQAVAILRDLHALTGRGRLVFPGLRSINRPLSENTLNVALRTLGFDGRTMTAHGFRAMASTRLNELGWSPDVIERQLAHAERNKVRAAYNRAAYLADRRRMMMAWADYLDSLRAGADNVVALKRGTRRRA